MHKWRQREEGGMDGLRKETATENETCAQEQIRISILERKDGRKKEKMAIIEERGWTEKEYTEK